MKDINSALSKGLITQIEERGNNQASVEFTKKDLEDVLEKIQRLYEQDRKRLLKLTKEWSEHWKNKRKEYPEEEPPMWLVAKTNPRMNQGNGGIWMTSAEVIKENKKWLD